MHPPHMQTGEAERIRALHALGLIDNGPEKEFDRLTGLARQLFDVSTALVSLIDNERQRLKSSGDAAQGERLLASSFCSHTMLGDEILCIPDARDDARFQNDPLVNGAPYIRFYAGCPVRSALGDNLGTFCLIDERPRDLDTSQRGYLRDLAVLVERELQLRELAQTDPLTGLANRRGFLAMADRLLHVGERAGLDAALVMIDLDGFKAINDIYGHAEGDSVLRRFADRLTASVRASDVCARLGGDEFAILLTGTPRQDPQGFIERLYGDTPAADVAHPDGGLMRFSHGIVRFDSGRHSVVADLLDEADTLMYRAKAGL